MATRLATQRSFITITTSNNPSNKESRKQTNNTNNNNNNNSNNNHNDAPTTTNPGGNIGSITLTQIEALGEPSESNEENVINISEVMSSDVSINIYELNYFDINLIEYANFYRKQICYKQEGIM